MAETTGVTAPAAERHATPPPALLSLVVWSIPAIFYVFAFFLRSSPAVMTAELMRSFGIGARDLGSLSAFYFYAYVLMQIPTGMLIDSLGPRKLLIFCSISTAVGTLLFGVTSSFAVACAGRAIVGGSTAAAWLVILKLATHWFPSRRFAMLSGLGLLIGNIGALTAQVPLRLLVENFNWRAVVTASAAVILLVALLAWIFVRNDPSLRGYRSYAPLQLQTRQKTSFGQLGAGFKRIFGFRNTWLIFFAQGGLAGPIMTFTGLWGPPFLKARFAIPSTTAAAVCSVMIVCWAGASPIFGALSDKIGRRKPLYVAGSLVSAAGWATMFYVTSLPLSVFIGSRGAHQYCFGICHPRLRLRQGIGARAISRNGFRRHQHRQHDRPDTAATRHRTHPGAALDRCDGKRRARLRRRGVPGGISSQRWLDRALLRPFQPHARDGMRPGRRLKHTRRAVRRESYRSH